MFKTQQAWFPHRWLCQSGKHGNDNGWCDDVGLALIPEMSRDGIRHIMDG